MKKSKLFLIGLTLPLLSLSLFGKSSVGQVGATPLPPSDDIPRLQTMTLTNDPTTSMSFNWNTTNYNDTDLQIIQKGGSFAGENVLKFKGTAEKSKAQNDKYVHRVKATGLTPNTEYEYRFGDAEIGSWCETGSFKTSSLDTSDFTFVHLSDPQGKTASHYEEYAKLLKLVDSEVKPNFLALTGDIVDGSHSVPALDQWEMALSEQFEILKNYPVAPVAGNHEVAPYDFSSRFNLDTPNTDTGETGNYYSFDYQGVHFVGLNTNDTQNKKTIDATGLSQAQLSWLEEDLKSHQENKMRIVMMHKGIFDSGAHSSNVAEPPEDYDIAEIRKQCAPLFTKYHVNLVLQGHDHLYSLSQPTIASVDTNKVSYEVDDHYVVEKKTIGNEEINTYTNLKGTFYLNSGTASGSKYYEPLQQTNTDISIIKTENTGKKMFSRIDIIGNNIVVKTYTVDGHSLNLYHQFAIECAQAEPESNKLSTTTIIIIVASSVVGLALVGGTVLLILKKKKRRA